MGFKGSEQSEKEFSLSESCYGSLFGNYHTIMLIIDPVNGSIIEANPAAERYYGWTRRELQEKKISDLNLNSPDVVRSDMAQSAKNESNHFFFKHQLRDGSIRDVEVFSGPVAMNGRTLLFSVIHDITERKIAEETLRETRDYLENLVNYANAPIIVWDNEFRITQFNKAFEQLSGRNAIDVLGQHVKILFPTATQENYIEYIKRASAGERWEVVEIEIQHVDGSILTFLWNSAVIYSNDGKRIVSTIAQGQNITKRKIAEKALQESEAKFRALFTEMSEGFALHQVIYDSDLKAIDYKILDINPAFEKQVGISIEKAKGTLATQLYGVTEAPYLDIYSVVAETGQHRFFQTYFKPLNRYYEVSVFSPNPGFFATVFTDITDRKLTDETQAFLLQCGLPDKGEDFFEALAKYIARTLNMDYVCIDRLEGDGLNAQTVAVYNDGIIESNVRYALKDTPCGAVLDKRICCYARGVQQLFPKDKALQELGAESYYGTTLWDSKGKPIGLIAVIGHNPLDDPKRAESLLKLVAPNAAGELERRQADVALQENEVRLRELNATKDKFFSIIAHDLKSPFSAIFGFSDLLINNFRQYDDNQIEKFLQTITESSKHAYNLLENLLIWSRSQTGRIEYAPVRADLQVCINENISLIENQAGEKNIRVSSESSGKFMVPFDKNMIDTVLRNLLTNAVKFTPQGGSVAVGIRSKDDMCEVYVSDTGIGLSKETINLLFRIESNLTTQGTENEKGTGLGLILCKEFVEKHGGRIWVESKSEKGSIFVFTLPMTHETVF